jgi:hypothetical protein
LILCVARQQDQTLGKVIMWEGHGAGVRRLDFFPIHQRRLMLWRRDRGFFTDGDIDDERRDTEDEETQSARCQQTTLRE